MRLWRGPRRLTQLKYKSLSPGTDPPSVQTPQSLNGMQTAQSFRAMKANIKRKILFALYSRSVAREQGKFSNYNSSSVSTEEQGDSTQNPGLEVKAYKESHWCGRETRWLLDSAPTLHRLHGNGHISASRTSRL